MDYTERLFATLAAESGFEVSTSPSIYCHPPVANKHGDPVKSKTTPDFFLTHQRSRRQMYVEVTQGGGGGRHKAAQQRVVEAAGVENYIQIRGDEIAALAALLTPEAREAFLLQLFNW